jgi:hypothetical protein
VTVILAIPLLYMLLHGPSTFPKRNWLFIIAGLVLILSLSIIYIGMPVITKQFVINKKNIDSIQIQRDMNTNIDLHLSPDLFRRADIELIINKSDSLELKTLHLTVYDKIGTVIRPVFPPLAWNLSKGETIEMGSFFEPNEYTRLNSFKLSGEYSIDNLDSIGMHLDYELTGNGRKIVAEKLFEVRIQNRLAFEKLLEF